MFFSTSYIIHASVQEIAKNKIGKDSADFFHKTLDLTKLIFVNLP